MTVLYYELNDDVELPSRWYLGAPKDNLGAPVNPEIFRVGCRTNVAAPLAISVRKSGRPLDFTFADFDMPVANQRVSDLLVALAPDSVQVIQARVVGHAAPYAVVNVLDVRTCVAEAESEYLKWREEDGRPDKTGQYRQFTRLVIDPTRAVGARLFRVDGWRIALIASRELVCAFKDAKISGVAFNPVAVG